MNLIRAFISGSSSGLGNALTSELLKADWGVVGLGRSNSVNHPNYEHHQVNLSNPKAANSFLFPWNTELSKIILVNNAGSLGELNYLGNYADAALEETLMLNLVAPVLLINRFLNQTTHYKGEVLIINISSGAAITPYDGWSAYCSSKAGLDMLSKTLALEQTNLNHSKTHIYSIDPGVMDTGMQKKIRHSDVSHFSQKGKFVQLYEEGKLPNPLDVAMKLMKLINNPENYPENRYHSRDL
jgi:benzil reductase ((S)-benzoin forming)